MVGVKLAFPRLQRSERVYRSEDIYGRQYLGKAPFLRDTFERNALFAVPEKYHTSAS